MTTKTTRQLRRTAMSFALLAPGLALAQADTSDWKCESCPFDSGARAAYEAGGTYVSDDAARFGNGTGYDEKGGYANLDGAGRLVSDEYLLDWTFADLGVDSRMLQIDGGLQGKFGFHLGYRELPYRRFDTTSTIFTQAASDRLLLPSGWVPAGTTAGFTQLAASLVPQNIGTDRQIVDLGADWTPANQFRLFADFRRQTRDGIDITSGPSYTQTSFLPRFIDFETDQIDAGVQYATERASLTLAYYGSFFTNNNPSLTWETPYTAAPGATTLRMAREPDNDFQQVSLSGKYRFDAADTIIAASLATGTGEQDQDLLPYTINPDLVGNALPVPSLGAEVDTMNYALMLTSRPFDKVRVKFGYRYDERDNTTPQYDWTRVIVDLFALGKAEQNTPYSFERSHLTLSGELVTWKDIRISGGYDRRTIKRDYQEVAEQTVDEGWGQMRWQPLAWFDFTLKGGASERDIDRYDETVGISLGQNPLMRKYYLAYRYRTFGELVASITPVDSPLAFTTTVLMADDSYSQSRLGLTDSEELRVTADLSWAIAESTSVYFMVGHEAIDALQTGSEQFSTYDWVARHDDTFDHFGAGLRYAPVDGKLALRFDYNRGDGNTSIFVDSLSGGPSDLPDLESTLDSARIEASYAFSERLEGTFDLRYERFELADFAMVSEATLPTVLTMGADPYDYDVYAVGIGIRYRFGVEKLELAD